MDLKIGADPELFLSKNGRYISAHDLLPGSKAKPFKVDKGAIQPDGLAAEFNIDASSSIEEFSLNINTVLHKLKDMIPPDVSTNFISSINFPKKYMDDIPFENKRLGCDPDYNAYTLDENPRPEEHPTLRTAAGHIHLGWGEGYDVKNRGHFLDCAEVAKQLDWFLGMPSIFLDKKGKKRRNMYGKAGAFRPKSYGMEYRVLSNFWLSSPVLIEWVYSQTQLAFSLLVAGDNYTEKHFHVQNIIDSNSISFAKYDCIDFGIIIPEVK